jgi:tRNA A37 threonylcarbamoyladenosine modification protein TsaB
MLQSMSAPRYILAIECSNPGPGSGAGTPGVALGRLIDGRAEAITTEAVRPSGRGGHDDDLMPAINRLFRAAGVSPRDGALATVAVSIGPGGYTSVRVACAAGKLIAEACGAKCVAVPTAFVAIESLPDHGRTVHAAVALAGKGETAWLQVFALGSPVEPGRIVSAADLTMFHESGVRLLIADSFLPATMRTAAVNLGWTIVSPVLDASACVRLGAQLPAIDPAELVPLYPREPDAVTLWRNRKIG